MVSSRRFRRNMEQTARTTDQPALPVRFRSHAAPLAKGQDVERSIHFVKYMGSKRNLLPAIIPTIRNVVPQGSVLLDIMAGTHAVGYSLTGHAAVWGNDI